MGDKKPDLTLLARLSPPSPLSGKPIDRSFADSSRGRQFGNRHPLTVRAGCSGCPYRSGIPSRVMCLRHRLVYSARVGQARQNGKPGYAFLPPTKAGMAITTSHPERARGAGGGTPRTCGARRRRMSAPGSSDRPATGSPERLPAPPGRPSKLTTWLACHLTCHLGQARNAVTVSHPLNRRAAVM
jgi:hypothetical protein